MYVFVTFFTAMEIVHLYIQVDFVTLIFLDILSKPTEKKSNKYKLKCEKTCGCIDRMMFRTTQSNFPC